tara:strand:- start:926 stop:1081 length:156 start_codon:yes stop_codon:yes gene_type:complete
MKLSIMPTSMTRYSRIPIGRGKQKDSETTQVTIDIPVGNETAETKLPIEVC